MHLPPRTESFHPGGAMMRRLPRPLHLSHRERSKSSFMISGEGFSPSSCPHPESTALSSPRLVAKRREAKPTRGSSNKKNWIHAFAGITDASASVFLHLSHRERSKSSFMISGEGFSPSSCPHPNFGKRNSTSPGGRGKAAGFSLIELAIVLVILGLLAT